MIIDTKSIAAQYPKWIRNSNAFKKTKSIRKVFPKIGLANFQEHAKLNYGQDVINLAKSFILNAFFAKMQYGLLPELQGLANGAYPTANKELRERARGLEAQLRAIYKIDYTSFIKQNTASGKVDLVVPANAQCIIGDKTFREGASFFKLYNSAYNEVESIMTMTRKHGIYNYMTNFPRLEEGHYFKEFSASNINVNDVKLVFSSTGKEGVWDIATMSMRGIKSCQTWESGRGNDRHVIGSMIDPCTAIIYLTSGSETKYGSKMMRRCVIHYVFNTNTQKPALLMERMYPSYNKQAVELFMKRLADKSKLPVISADVYRDYSQVLPNLILPLSSELKTMKSSERPYFDSKIPIRAYDKFKYAKVKSSDAVTAAILRDTIIQIIKSRNFSKSTLSNKFNTKILTLTQELRSKDKQQREEFAQKLSTNLKTIIEDGSDRKEIKADALAAIDHILTDRSTTKFNKYLNNIIFKSCLI